MISQNEISFHFRPAIVHFTWPVEWYCSPCRKLSWQSNEPGWTWTQNGIEWLKVQSALGGRASMWSKSTPFYYLSTINIFKSLQLKACIQVPI